MRGFLRILGNRRRFSSIKSHEPFKVAFCGNGHFVRAFELSQAALARFPDVVVQQYDPIELEKDIETINVIIPFMTKITPSLINKAKNLKLIIQYGVGLEGVDILAAKEKKISVCKIPSTECANALSCAEHSIFLALSSFRDINGMKNSLLTGRIGFPCGRTLFGSTAVVYGLGGIGRELCVRLHALGVKCHVVVRNLPPPEEINALKERYHFSSLHTKETWNNVSPDADILFFCLTVNESSKNMVDKNFLSNLKPGVVLINVSRVSTSNIFVLFFLLILD